MARDPTLRAGSVQLFVQSITIGAQLFGQSIIIGVQLFSQSSTRNLHGACTNLGTSSRAQSGSVIRERCSCHQMDHAPQGVEGLICVNVLPKAEARARECASVLLYCTVTAYLHQRMTCYRTALIKFRLFLIGS
jgi:hypothetical protein